MISFRCAGYNNVDIEYCYNKIHVLRVPAHPPYVVVEHIMTLLLTLVKKTHLAYIRTRNFNFSIENLVGFDLNVIAYGTFKSDDIDYVGL